MIQVRVLVIFDFVRLIIFNNNIAPKEMETSTDSVHYRMREGAVIPAALIYCVLMKSTNVQTLGTLRLLIDAQSY